MVVIGVDGDIIFEETFGNGGLATPDSSARPTGYTIGAIANR